MHRFRNILVALTRGETDPELIRHAAMVARLAKADEVRFVHVLSRSSPVSSSALSTSRQQVTSPSHDQALEEMQQEVNAHFAEAPVVIRVECQVLHGPLVDQLLAHAAEQEVDLIFVGHQRGHAGRRALARRLAMKAPCSVWMVPQGSPLVLQRILVPLDFSEHAADTMQVATSLARLKGDAECIPLHVYFNEAHVTFDDYDQILRGQEQQAYQDFIRTMDCRDVTVTPCFEEGANVAHTIQRVAEEKDIDLIVMATRGRSRSAAILLGSVTEEVLMEARVPVLVVKHFGARLGVLQALLDRRFRSRGNPQFD